MIYDNNFDAEGNVVLRALYKVDFQISYLEIAVTKPFSRR